MANETAEKDYGIDECPSTYEVSENKLRHDPSASELPENKLRYNFRLGDLTWVKPSGSLWWPAQVIDEACVGTKPKKKSKLDCLVRLYGTCQYLYVDPWKCNAEFEAMLNQENKSAIEVFHEVFQKDLSHVNSPSDHEEEAVNSKGGNTKMARKKTSSRKVRKQEGLKQWSYKGVNGSATAENQGDETEQQYNEERDQDVGSTAATGAAIRKRQRAPARQSSSTQTADKASSESSAEGFIRDKRQKQVAQGASVGKREGLRRSTRSNAAEDKTAPLTGTGATEDPTAGETSASHTEIKAMVRDILFKEIIDREHDADMAFVDEVINGICNIPDDNITDGATRGEGAVKQSGGRVDGESSNVTQRHGEGKLDEATEDKMQVTSRPGNMEGATAATPSRDATMKERGQLSERQVRQIKIMQSLGLIAPSGSPFGTSGVFAATKR